MTDRGGAMVVDRDVILPQRWLPRWALSGAGGVWFSGTYTARPWTLSTVCCRSLVASAIATNLDSSLGLGTSAFFAMTIDPSSYSPDHSCPGILCPSLLLRLPPQETLLEILDNASSPLQSPL